MIDIAYSRAFVAAARAAELTRATQYIWRRFFRYRSGPVAPQRARIIGEVAP